MFCFVVFLDLPVASVLVAAALAALLLSVLFHRLDRDASIERSRTYGDFGAEFLDAVQGLVTLKAFGRSAAKARSLARRADQLGRDTRWVNATNALGRGITDASIAIGAAAALALGAWRVDSGAMELSTLLIVLMMGVELFRPLRDMRTHLHTGMLGQSPARAIFRILDAEPPVAPPATGAGEPEPGDAGAAPAVAFEDIVFAYPGSDRRAHDGLSFAVEAGERIGVVGASGAGKTSIVRLMLRFYDPDAGRVRMAGRDLRTLPLAELRDRIAVVHQDTYLFHGTVEDNLRFGAPRATAGALEAAARAANAHDFIRALPQGYGTVIGERGIRLSGGQRQRVAIARALLRDAPILVLDEALSAVDAENEAAIQQALDRLMRGRTTLIFAHRLSSVIDADRILVLDRGRVVEEGRHGALMARGGAYRRLMAEQARELGRLDDALEERRERSETLDRDIAEAAAAQLEPSDGILRAEGLGWAGATRALLSEVAVERLRLTLALVFGVARVAAFIGVGALSALIVPQAEGGPALRRSGGGAGRRRAGGRHPALARELVRPRHGLQAAGRDAPAPVRQAGPLAPAYLLHRRTGDLAALATQDIETVESFYAHTVAPALVALLVPAAVLAVLLVHGWPLALALLPFLALVAFSPFVLRRRPSTGWAGACARHWASSTPSPSIPFRGWPRSPPSARRRAAARLSWRSPGGSRA